MVKTNLLAAWFGIFLGIIAGLIQGLFFHDDNWLGGYTSWKRRMVRLGHISFFGIAFINLAFAMSIQYFGFKEIYMWTSTLFILTAIAMPLVCYLSVFNKNFRHLFAIPVFFIIIGTVILIMGILFP